MATLLKLVDAFDRGLLTEAEFAIAQRQLLAPPGIEVSIPPPPPPVAKRGPCWKWVKGRCPNTDCPFQHEWCKYNPCRRRNCGFRH